MRKQRRCGRAGRGRCRPPLIAGSSVSLKPAWAEPRPPDSRADSFTIVTGFSDPPDSRALPTMTS